MTTTAWEYLGDPGREAPRRPRAGWALLALLVAIGATAGGLWLSDQVRTTATEHLATTFEQSRQVARAGEGSVLGTLSYASPMIWSTEVGEDVRAGLRGLVEDSAARVSERLAGVRAEAAAIRVLPWQPEQARAQEALLTVIDAEAARFQAIARDARDLDTVLASGPVDLALVRQALREAGVS